MTDWQITAKTIFCDAVDDEVTVIVQRDGSTTCTGFKKYTQPNDITRKLAAQKSKRLKRPIKCESEPCSRTNQYKENIMAEETR
jgi:hypothetical protein